MTTKPIHIGIMSDIESLALGSNVIVLEAGFMPFILELKPINDEGEEVWFPQLAGRSFRYTASIDEQQKFRNISASTLLWWLDTNPQYMKHILQRPEADMKEPPRLHSLLKTWMETHASTFLSQKLGPGDLPRFWFNGNRFDQANIEELIDMQGGDYYPWKYNMTRDLRTAIDLAGLHDAKSVVWDRVAEFYQLQPHDAVNDCIIQIGVLAECFNQIENRKTFTAAASYMTRKIAEERGLIERAADHLPEARSPDEGYSDWVNEDTREPADAPKDTEESK